MRSAESLSYLTGESCLAKIATLRCDANRHGRRNTSVLLPSPRPASLELEDHRSPPVAPNLVHRMGPQHMELEVPHCICSIRDTRGTIPDSLFAKF